MKYVLPISALLPAILCANVFAQSVKHATIPKIEHKPTIDGSLDIGEWDIAQAIDDLHQTEPVEYAEPSQRTVWYVVYDAEALYVAAYAYDTDPGGIVARTLRQGGSINDDDTMSITIDAFNNKRGGYKFSLNPNGVRQDAIYASPTRASEEWDGIWRGAARIVDDGWTMEMAIPFKTLSFSPDNPVWGINFDREIPRLAEEIAWSSRNGQVNPTVSGELAGFSDLNQGVGLDVIPSLSSSTIRNHEFDSRDSETRPSLDVNYKLTSAINWLVTINTDFAATEVDARQLDVSRFSLFFPEKRSFFLTDFDIFQFGGISNARGFNGGLVGSSSGTNALPFFSRRVGLGPSRQPVDLIAGTKLSGRIGDTDFGLLYVRQDEVIASDPMDDDIDASDLVVARVSRGVFEESSIGAIFTSGDPATNETSSLAGLDFNYRNTRLKNNRSVEAQVWVQKSTNAGVSGKDLAYSAALGFPTRKGWEAGFQYHVAEENYNPALGFANRTGVRLISGQVGRKWIFGNEQFIQSMNSNTEFERWTYLDTGQLQSQRLAINFLNINTSSGDFSRIGVDSHKERLLPGEQPLDRLNITIPPGTYSFDRPLFFFRTAEHRKLSANVRLDGGDFYNGDRLHVRPRVQWTPSKHLSFSLEYDYNKYDFPGVVAYTRQITFNNEIAFNSAWSLLTLAQYDNLSQNIGINMRLRYNRSAGQDFWLVANHNMEEQVPNDGFRSIQTFAALKVRYTFRF